MNSLFGAASVHKYSKIINHCEAITNHILTRPACGFAIEPLRWIDPHEVKAIANQQQIIAKMPLIFQEVEKVTVGSSSSVLSSMLP